MSTEIRNVPFLRLAVNDVSHKRELLGAVERVLDHGRIVRGPEVDQFEAQVATLSKRRFAVGVSSGTNALYLALKVLGLARGDEVITTSLSWIATMNAIAATGAMPVCIDIRDDLNMDPEAFEAALTPRTRAVVVVHYTGLMCDMDAILKIAAKAGIAIVEDAAQAFGATLRGRPAGNFGALAAVSMNPMKVLRAYGDAGVVLTDDPAHVSHLNRIVYAGVVDKERCVEIALNSRMDTIQAAMLLVNIDRLDALIERRRSIAARYTSRLSDVVVCPKESQDSRHVYYTYTILADDRDRLKAALEGQGIETKIQHPILMPEQPAYAHLPSGQWGNARRLRDRILCLPAHEDLDADSQDYVIKCVRGFYGR